MPDYHNTLHYLLIEVSGHVFAVPMSEVTAIRRLSDEDMPAPEADSAGQATIPIVDLRRLFFPATQLDAKHPAYVIVISAPTLTCAVLVDDVRPARRAEAIDQFALPPLLAKERYPFGGVVREADGLVLIIDVCLLAEELRQVKPDLIVEKPHGS